MAIRTLDYFDLKEDDDYNLKLLHEYPIKELNDEINLLDLAYKGKCQKFVSTLTVQKTIHMRWQSFDMEITKQRKDHSRITFKSKLDIKVNIYILTKYFLKFIAINIYSKIKMNRCL